jgi:hypothetical protein
MVRELGIDTTKLFFIAYSAGSSVAEANSSS